MNVLVFSNNCGLLLGYETPFQTRALGQPVDVDFQGFPLWGEEYVETNLASCNGLVCIELYIIGVNVHPNIWFGTHLPKVAKTYQDQHQHLIQCLVGFAVLVLAMIIPLIVMPYKIFPFDIKRIEIFSLKTFTWKTILVDVDNICNHSVPLIPNTTYRNGAIYWSARKYVKPSIIYFELAKKIFHELLGDHSIFGHLFEACVRLKEW